MRVCDNCRESDGEIVEVRTQKYDPSPTDITKAAAYEWTDVVSGTELCGDCLEDLSKLDWSRLAQRQPAVQRANTTVRKQRRVKPKAPSTPADLTTDADLEPSISARNEVRRLVGMPDLPGTDEPTSFDEPMVIDDLDIIEGLELS